MIGKRVVVTGLASISPLGNDLKTSWSRLLAGESGIGPITRFDCQEFDTRIAGEVRDFVEEKYLSRKQIQRMDRFNRYAVASAQML
ncbi:MAG: beta-ketoacyl synthase N-terminal-like domain-containing protein, partial [Desulfohalobiaceae bacterium]